MSSVKNNTKLYFSELNRSIKSHWPVILLVVLGFIAVSAENFFNVSFSQTISSYTLEDFEIGQIADRTIFAPKSIPADELNPVFVEEGERIIRKGFPITEDGYAKLQKMAESPQYLDLRSFANSELYLALLGTMWFLLFTFAPFGRKVSLRELIFQVVCFLIVYAVTAFGIKTTYFEGDFFLIIIIPASLFILMCAILYGQLSAIFCSIIFSFGVFNACGYHVVPFLYTLATCLTSSTIVRKVEQRNDMLLVTFMQSVFNVVIVILLAVIFYESYAEIPTGLRWLVILGVFLNGILSGILVLGLITPVEMILNTASVFRLMDLCNTDAKILKKMFVTAPGTYSHSQAVSQMAETACREINANWLLAKVSALYHDIGKIEQSEYFTENVPPERENPINSLAPTLAATIIKSHVRKGVEMAHQLHLPEQVIDIIEEHHGNSVIAYFYDKALKQDANVNKIDFSYPNNPPSSKESAVVMLVDTFEAASRSLENPTEERLEKFIQVLIDGKMESGQLDRCALTFRDITKIKETSVKFLANYHHSRVKYPNQKDPDEVKKSQETQEKESESETEKKSADKSESLEKSEKSAEKTEKSDKSEKSEKSASKAKSKKDTELGDKTLEEARING